MCAHFQLVIAGSHRTSDRVEGCLCNALAVACTALPTSGAMETNVVVLIAWTDVCVCVCVQLAEAALDLRRAVAAVHMTPPAGVGERRVGPFDETLLDLAHAECLQELTADDDGRRALGVRGKWFAADGSVNRKTAFAACLVDEYGKLNSVFNLTGPLEVLALPLDNHTLRTLHTLCTTLGQVVELRAAIASMTVRYLAQRNANLPCSKN